MPGYLIHVHVFVIVVIYLSTSEPNRQTHMCGRDFIVALPLDGWKLEAAGSFLQIACVSGGLE